MFSLRLRDKVEAKHSRDDDGNLATFHRFSKQRAYCCHSERNITNKVNMLFLCILTMSIALSTVKAEEDLEITLNGSQVIQLELSSRLKASQDIEITLLFRTTFPSGVVFSAFGVNGDFVFIEMIRGKLR